jgi:hypothetical protein
VVNRPFPIALGTAGATSTPRTPGQRHVRRYLRRRCTIAGQLDLPVDLLTGLLPERDVTRAAARTHPLPLGNIMDLLTGQQMVLAAATVPA